MKNQIKLGLIDDESLALDRLSYFISGIPGYHVEFAETNPLDGLRFASQKICDILITDVQMEKLNGLLISEQMEELGVPGIFFMVENYASFGYTKVAFSSLYYVEQKQNYSLFHAPPNIYKQRSTLQSVEIMLPELTFVRVQKSFLVNITKLEKILHKEIILDNGIVIPLGDSYKDQLLNAYKLFNRP